MANLTNPQEIRSGGMSQPGNEPKTRPAEKTGQVAEKARDLATTVADKTKDLAVAIAESAGEMATNAGQRAKEGAGAVAHRVGDMASQMGQKAEDATSSLGGSMQSLAGSVRQKGPREGMMGAASDAVAQTLERTGRYLQEEGLKGIGEDAASLIRRYPIQSVLIGIGIGFLIARSTRS